jgi:ankyrin repeat protein
MLLKEVLNQQDYNS